MEKLTIGIIKEGKTPPDMRVPLTPQQVELINLENKDINVVVQSSNVRTFEDAHYTNYGVEVVPNVSNADILMGVKEVPISMLIPNKTYFFFSHTIKEQPYNRDLLLAILDKNITMIDYEGLTSKAGHRLIGFGYYAGIVGAYNGLMAWGKRNKTFSLPDALTLHGIEDMKRELGKIELPHFKIALTGTGRVASGVVDVMEMAGVQKVSPEVFLTENFEGPVFTQLGVLDYNKRKDGEKKPVVDFYDNFTEYESNFFRFAKVTDLYISGHFYAEDSPFIFTREEAKHPDFKIQVVADISCDIDGPVASTLRPSTIADPLYGYDAKSESETDFNAPGAITVMAVDNLPCELPAAASEGFGAEFIKNILPALKNGDADGVLERATITRNGKLTELYSYLQNFVDGTN